MWGVVRQESKHGSSGAEMDDTQYELNKSDFWGGITDNAEFLKHLSKLTQKGAIQYYGN